ncbi:hypothetical protein TSH58p_22680 (plasmid) [Azospirillum sp. TSH58]|uniref:hypothetical protein n=1 Tax=Azospirillum sp. TSH58 TaxID=664962 RepID=UPI000D60234A|nr:hypothetical protein [Azospirillum sp. TSH58]AWJ86324.1 hypothetical protein TSH58p_22680 [Azospirillum sp. TSH58]PWC73426.1 hypothetical protein TSH58_04435 [Azospirillum sp. TSH58]
MPTSVREQVLAAFETLLGSVTAPNVPGTFAVYRGRRKAVPETNLPALVMQASIISQDQFNAGVVRNLERVAVSALVKETTDTALDQALADVSAAVQKAVEADPTLGGLVVDTNLSEADQATANDEGIGGIGEAFLAFTVEFWTRPGDPYTAAP